MPLPTTFGLKGTLKKLVTLAFEPLGRRRPPTSTKSSFGGRFSLLRQPATCGMTAAAGFHKVPMTFALHVVNVSTFASGALLETNRACCLQRRCRNRMAGPCQVLQEIAHHKQALSRNQVRHVRPADRQCAQDVRNTAPPVLEPVHSEAQNCGVLLFGHPPPPDPQNGGDSCLPRPPTHTLNNGCQQSFSRGRVRGKIGKGDLKQPNARANWAKGLKDVHKHTCRARPLCLSNPFAGALLERRKQRQIPLLFGGRSCLLCAWAVDQVRGRGTSGAGERPFPTKASTPSNKNTQRPGRGRAHTDPR